jgi:hypothetical protein
MSLFDWKIIKTIGEYCIIGKLDIATFEKLCLISFDDEGRKHAEKLALMASDMAFKTIPWKLAKAAFFAGLLFNDIGDRMISPNIFNGRDENKEKCEKVKTCIVNIFHRCNEGNIFIAHCVALQHKLCNLGYKLKEEDLPIYFSEKQKRKCLKAIEDIEKIVDFCDRKIKEENIAQSIFKGKNAIT